MYIVPINEIVELNKLIEESGLGIKIHLKDGCSGQSMWIEEAANDKEQEGLQNLSVIIENYFSSKRVTIQFSDDRQSFWTV